MLSELKLSGLNPEVDIRLEVLRSQIYPQSGTDSVNAVDMGTKVIDGAGLGDFCSVPRIVAGGRP